MEAFIRDYLMQAEWLDQCPMSCAAIGTILDNSEASNWTSCSARCGVGDLKPWLKRAQ